MQIGDTLFLLPTLDSEAMLQDRKPQRCVVVYIHPQWRFYSVRFDFEGGRSYCETFYFRDRDPKGPPLPDHLAHRMMTEPPARFYTRRASRQSDAWRPLYS